MYNNLRAQIRQKRKSVSPLRQHFACRKICYQLLRQSLFRTKQNIAIFLSFDGEIATDELIKTLSNQGHTIYLPVLCRQKLKFARYQKGMMQKNKFGIQEPKNQTRHNPRQMNIVFTPLVAFDSHANRLGMGGGFYDKSFAFLHRRRGGHYPKLYGLAYEFQRVNLLHTNAWDIALDGVITPKCFYAGNN